MSRVTLLGNVGQPSKVTYYDGGNRVAQVSLVTPEEEYTLQNGTQVPGRTEWHSSIFYNRLVEIVDQHVYKGDRLYVGGKIWACLYDDQTDVKCYVTEVSADNMEMFSPRNAISGTAAQAGVPGQMGTLVQLTQSQVTPT